jgi:hypothetical protein
MLQCAFSISSLVNVCDATDCALTIAASHRYCLHSAIRGISRRAVLIASIQCQHFALLRLQLLPQANSHYFHTHTIVLHSAAFYGCAGLTSANLTGVESIGEYVSHLLDSLLFLSAC